MKTRKVDYKSKKFLKGLERIKKLIKISKEQAIPDKDKMRDTFNL